MNDRIVMVTGIKKYIGPLRLITRGLIIRGLLGVMVLLSACPMEAGAFVMVKDRMPVCFIVLRKDAPKAEHYAARELADYVEKMTGTPIPIREMEYSDIPETGRAVLIGQGRWLDLPRFGDIVEDMETLGSQGYFIRTHSEHEPEALVVTGASPRATLYAVYELLKRLGVRWYTPRVTKIPRAVTIDLKDIKIADFPCFPYRGVSLDNGDASPEWIARLRLNADPGFLEHELDCKPEYMALDVPLGNFFSRKDFERNPDMFPLVNGERTDRYDLCCFSSLKARTAVTDSITAWLSNNPSITHVVLHIDESGLLCTCKECEQAAQKEGNAVDVMLSWIIGIGNRVARSSGKTSFVLALPANFTGTPKRNHFSEHVAVRINDESCDISRPFDESIDKQTVMFEKEMRQWLLHAETVFVLHHIGNRDYPSAPFPDFSQVFTNTLMFRDEFIQGLFFQYAALPGVLVADDEMRMWVLSQLLWNSDQNANDLVREWIKGVYGMAWGPMVDYWRHLHGLVKSPQDRITLRTNPLEYITEDWLNTADRIIQRGYAQSMTDSTAHRYVRKTRLSLWYVRLLMAQHKVESSGKSPDKKTIAEIMELLKKWEKDMTEFGYDRVSEQETVAQFAQSIRTLIDSHPESLNR